MESGVCYRGGIPAIEALPFGVKSKGLLIVSASAARSRYVASISVVRSQDLTWEVGDVQGLKSISLNDTKVLAKTIKVKYTPSLDALLSDIYISTSAAPTYLPAHQFQTKDPQGEVREFNLVNGGVAANDPMETTRMLKSFKFMEFRA